MNREAKHLELAAGHASRSRCLVRVFMNYPGQVPRLTNPRHS